MEKQNLIIDAALKTFAMHGYKKTSISDIASTAGISKAMVFHYFGTKKELYLYLVNTCVDSISTEVVEKLMTVLQIYLIGFCIQASLSLL